MQVQPVRSYTPNFNGLGHRLVKMSKIEKTAKNVADRFSKKVEENGSNWRQIARDMFRD
jgi:hypothetical protein